MKKTTYMAEISKLDAGELRQRAHTLAEEQMKLRFRSASGQLQQSHHLRETRRNLARVQTVLNAQRKAGKTTKAA